jgi:hypothetical protein
MNGVACGSGRLYNNHGFGVVAGVYRQAPMFKCSQIQQEEVAEAAPILGTEVNLHALSLIVAFEWAAHLLLILEVLASNLGPNTGYDV